MLDGGFKAMFCSGEVVFFPQSIRRKFQAPKFKCWSCMFIISNKMVGLFQALGIRGKRIEIFLDPSPFFHDS